jgi:hypothetical protein
MWGCFLRWLVGAVFLGLVAVGGCREREFARTTPGMEVEQRFWVRVLLLDDVKDGADVQGRAGR